MLGVVSDVRRRRILASLVERSGTTTERELATELVAVEREVSDGGASAGDVRSMRIELRHVHLPKLADADLVTWNESGATVTATDHPRLSDPRFELLLGLDGEWDAVVESLADERRCAVLDAVESGRESLTVDELTHEVAARVTSGEPSTRAVDRTRVQLHHVHLPKLDEAGLVEYDVDAGTVTYRGLDDVTEANLFSDAPV